MQMWTHFSPCTVKENEKLELFELLYRAVLSNSCFFFGGGVDTSLTSCKVTLFVTYWHLPPFACPGGGGSFAGGEVCLGTQSHYHDRSLPPILVVYKKCSIFLNDYKQQCCF